MDEQRAAAGPLPLFPRGDEPPPMAFRRGTREPYGIRWFGSTALLGHLRHLGAERLASGQRDTRDWMRAQPPAGLLREVARVLEAPNDGETLAERLGRDVWIDFVADTGDDWDVGAAWVQGNGRARAFSHQPGCRMRAVLVVDWPSISTVTR